MVFLIIELIISRNYFFSFSDNAAQQFFAPQSSCPNKEASLATIASDIAGVTFGTCITATTPSLDSTIKRLHSLSPASLAIAELIADSELPIAAKRLALSLFTCNDATSNPSLVSSTNEVSPGVLSLNASSSFIATIVAVLLSGD